MGLHPCAGLGRRAALHLPLRHCGARPARARAWRRIGRRPRGAPALPLGGTNGPVLGDSLGGDDRPGQSGDELHRRVETCSDRLVIAARTRYAVAPMSCPSCGAAASPNQKFCAECGARMQQACPSCGVAYEGSPKFCPECGVGLQAAGTPVPAATTNGAAAPEIGQASSVAERKLVSVMFAGPGRLHHDVRVTRRGSGARTADRVLRRGAGHHHQLRRVGREVHRRRGHGGLGDAGGP